MEKNSHLPVGDDDDDGDDSSKSKFLVENGKAKKLFVIFLRGTKHDCYRIYIVFQQTCRRQKRHRIAAVF